MSSQAAELGTRVGFGATERRDAWWIGPLVTALGFGGFIVYTTFRIFHNKHYLIDTETSAHILSPMYSPLFAVPDWLPTWFSPAMFILWMPGGFRMTCYYYRKAYYRAYFVSPPACAVQGTGGTGYNGERFLLLWQNLHRFMLYFALLIIVILSYDAALACIWPDGEGGKTFGVSVATIILSLNAVLLAGYTLGCHSLRHLVGGRLDCFDCENFVGNARYKAWKGVSFLNKNHMAWAWVSLVFVAFADFYVWMAASGRIEDIVLFRL